MKKSLTAMLCIFMIFMPLTVYSEPKSFPLGVSLDGLVLSDYFYDDIKEIANEKLEQVRNNFNLSVIVSDKTYQITPDDIGWSYNISELVDEAVNSSIGTSLNSKITFDSAKIDELIQKICDEVCTDSVSATIESYNFQSGEIKISDSKTGIGINRDDFKKDLLKAIVMNSNICEVHTYIIDPDISKSNLANLIGVYNTTTTNVESRNYNISLASSSINKTRLMPGDTFSFFKTVGDTSSYSSQYKTAGTLTNGKASQGKGGGICQVSATLYCAVKQAGLKIIERHIHSARVSYVDINGEAMVNQGTADFKFQNTLDVPITIMFTYDNKNLSCFIFSD